MNPGPTVGAVIIAKNEEHILGDCIRSMAWMDEIIVIDDCSTDRTAEIAAQLGAKVVTHPMEDFARQRNFGIDQSTSEWLFHPDADMVLPPAFAEEVRAVLADTPHEAFGVRFNHYWLGHLMRYGGWRGKPWIRLARRRVRFVGEIHETLDTHGSIGQIDAPVDHYTDPCYRDRLEKSNRYSDAIAHQWYTRGKRFHLASFLFAPWIQGLYRYVIRAGFRDGLVGLMWFLHVVFINYVQHIKLWELERDAKAGHAAEKP